VCRRKKGEEAVKFYHSGVAGAKEYEMLMRAGSSRILVDQFDLKNIGDDRRAVALDCGEYKARKSGRVLELDPYLRVAREQGPFDFVLSLDRWNDHEATRANWLEIRRRGVQEELRIVPVWGWGGPAEHLTAYLDESEIVAVGGLVPLMREDDARMLEGLGEICEAHPNRLHILGMNSLLAIETLGRLVHSADSSKYLKGASAARIVFVHSVSGRLLEAHYKVFSKSKKDEVRRLASLDREGRCVENARALDDYVNTQHERRGITLADALKRREQARRRREKRESARAAA
jgi:hypothetical protein